ncbi:MAG: NTP transferase domain-containing protein [Pseudomonadota bacterium]|nr:NTP transferase domain-containing protein [Pseudomonadota bacterium]
MTEILSIIQARMGSSRVPGKAMVELTGKPLIWHMIDRLRRVSGVDQIVLATTGDPRNLPMIEFCEGEGLGVFAHPAEDDLAGRVAGAIAGRTGDIILKVGGDCPLIDPAVLQLMTDRALAEGDADFISNRLEWSYPLGLSADVMSRRSIEWSDANLTNAEDREFFATYVRDHPEQFKVLAIKNDVDLSHHGWTVDEPEDLVFVRRIFDALYREGECFGMSDVLAFLDTEGIG